MRSYQFYLALENTNCQDYVSEKLLNVYDAGIVPIVDGPDNYTSFAPDENAVIRIDNFESPKHLANYLFALIEDENKLIQTHLAYKPNPFSPEPRIQESFISTWHYSNSDSNSVVGGMCRMCRQNNYLDLVTSYVDWAGWDNRTDVVVQYLRKRQVTHAVLPDMTCRPEKWKDFSIDIKGA
jgi:hypothetical protein